MRQSLSCLHVAPMLGVTYSQKYLEKLCSSLVFEMIWIGIVSVKWCSFLQLHLFFSLAWWIDLSTSGSCFACQLPQGVVTRFDLWWFVAFEWKETEGSKKWQRSLFLASFDGRTPGGVRSSNATVWFLDLTSCRGGGGDARADTYRTPFLEFHFRCLISLDAYEQKWSTWHRRLVAFPCSWGCRCGGRCDHHRTAWSMNDRRYNRLNDFEGSVQALKQLEGAPQLRGKSVHEAMKMMVCGDKRFTWGLNPDFDTVQMVPCLLCIQPTFPGLV